MPNEATTTLELRDYLRVLWRHKWIIIVSVVVCTGAALVMSLTRTPQYTTYADVLIEQRLVETIFNPLDQQSSPLQSDRRRANEIQIMNSPRVRAAVEDDLGRAPEGVGFTPLEGTDVVRISRRGEDPKEIAKTVNAFAEKYLEVRTELTVEELTEVVNQLQSQIEVVQRQIDDLDASTLVFPLSPPDRNGNATDPRVAKRAQLASKINSYQNQQENMELGITVAQQGDAQILARAPVPEKPISTNSLTNIFAGIAIGLLIGVALAFLREYLDDSVKTKEDLEQASGLTVVGIVPALADWKKRDAAPLIAMTQPRSPAAEAYRSVRTSVEFLSLDQPIGSLQVTSALASEGKTSTLANLAVTFARAGQRVIVLCCDLRRPRLHEFFGLSNRVGFTSALLGDASIASVIQPADRELPIGLVASGPLPPNPAELLASARAVDAIEELDRRCDLLLIDSPPILPVTDGLVISGLVDAVLVVANGSSSTKRGVRRATELLRQVDAPLIGAILNGAQAKLEYGYAYGDNRYYLEGATPESPKSNDTNRRNGKPAKGSKRSPRVSAPTGN